MFAKILLAMLISIIFFTPETSAINCYQMNQQMSMQNQWYTCSSTVSQCFKFVCAGPTYYIYKGCYDLTSPLTNCQTLQGQCQGQGGVGTCYTCSKNKCNGASGTAFGMGILAFAALISKVLA